MVGTKVKYFTGLDLGQTGEFTALAVLEQTKEHDPGSPSGIGKRYAVRHLERFALGTPFPAVCERLAALFCEPPLRSTFAA